MFVSNDDARENNMINRSLEPMVLALDDNENIEISDLMFKRNAKENT